MDLKYCLLFIVKHLFSFHHQARLDQCKVTMETLEKQLEEEKQKAQMAESQRGAGTGNDDVVSQMVTAQQAKSFHTLLYLYIKL